MIFLENSIIDLVYSDSLYVSSWDNYLYSFDVSTLSLQNKIENTSPILKIKHINNLLIYTDVSGFVSFYAKDHKFKSITPGIRGIQALETHNSRLIFGGWSKRLCLYDNNSYEYLDIEGKVYGSFISDHRLLLNMGTRIQILDLRNMKIYFDKTYKEMNRSVLIRNEKIFLGSVGGKLIIEDIEREKTYTINAHCKTDEIYKVMYPVNKIVYDDYLYTGGSDGSLKRWMVGNKIKNKTVHSEKEGIQSFIYLKDKFIISSGYNFEQGLNENTKSKIFVKTFEFKG